MKDRISLNPGRVKLTPVTGETDLFDMEMADNPTELGTALNKANLLTDATAAAIASAYGSTPDTPNEALALLAGTKIEFVSYIGNGTYGENNKNSITFTHVPKFVILAQERQTGFHNLYIAFLDWATLIANNNNFRTYFRLFGNVDEHYELTNDNKTLTWYCDSSTYPEHQLNINNTKYTAVSFY